MKRTIHHIEYKTPTVVIEQRNQAAERNRGEQTKATGLALTSVQTPYYSRSEGRAMPAHMLPKTCKKRRKAPGTAERHSTTCDSTVYSAHEYRKLAPQPNPILVRDRIIKVIGNGGLVEIDKSPRWQPKGLIPKGF